MTHEEFPEPGDQNVERLLGQAYRPESIDPAFIERVQQRLDEVASEGQSPGPRVSPRRLAASLAGIAAIFLLIVLPQAILPILFQRGKPDASQKEAAKPGSSGKDSRRVRHRPRVPELPTVNLGETIRTAAGQKRRLRLPDGSVLSVNENTRVKLQESRRLVLEAGEVFVEVTPRPASGENSRFVVRTPQREVTALGTRFAVRAGQKDTGVLVTQGKVKVSGLENILRAGQQFAGGKVAPAPRVSHALAWTRDLLARTEPVLVPASEFAGGALVAAASDGQPASLSLRKYHIDVHIEDGFARTTIDQTYFNHHFGRLEGTFYFPLPADASLSRLAMYVDGTRMEGGMVERDYGRNVYESIVRRQKDPALLEWIDGSTFKMRVFPLEGRQEKRIILSYTQRLPTLYGKTTYRFPAGHSLGKVRDWSFEARLKGDVLTWHSPSHSLESSKDSGDLLLRSAARDVKPDRDIVLELTATERTRGEPARFVSAEHEGSRYLMVRYRPELPAETAPVERRDWVFLFESSAERDPLLARTQIEVIRTLLNNAGQDDTFAVLTAATRTRALTPKPLPVTPDNVNRVLGELEGVQLLGALDLQKALTDAGKLTRGRENPWLVHLGSGLLRLGERRVDVLARKLPEGATYVGVAVGKHWNRGFMKAAAERTGGHFTQINPDEVVAWRAFDLLATLNTPRLLGVQVKDLTGNLSFLSSNSLVAQGEEFCAVARAEGRGNWPALVVLTGTLAGKPYRRELPVGDLVSGAGYLPRTWGRLEIDRRLAEDARGHKHRIIELSKQLHVMSPYTSLLVLENEAMYERFKVDRGRKDHWAAYNCPEKIPVVYEPLFGRPVPGRGKGQNQPQAAKPSAEQVLRTILIRVWTPHEDSDTGRFDTVTGYKPPDVLAPSPLSSSSVDEGFFFVGGGGVYRHRQSGSTNQGLALRALTFSPDGRLLASSGVDQTIRLWDVATGPSTPMQDSNIATNSGPGRIDPRRVKELAQVWGTLPQREQGQRMRELTRDMPLRYREAIEQYFRRLSRPAGDPGSRLTREADSGEMTFPDLRFTSGNNVNSIGTFPDRSGSENAIRRLAQIEILTEAIEKARGTSPSDRGIVAQIPDLDPQWMEREIRKSLQQMKSVVRTSGDDSRVQEFFHDLVIFAPGMNTTAVDLQAILESEADQQNAPRKGRIAPSAKALIERARAGGWQAVTIPAHGGIDSFVFCDGQGRYRYERTLGSGLREIVICDGKALLHLYPELGLGARRSVSRFHRLDLETLVPWLLSPAEDLAHGADLEAVDNRTVAVIPHTGTYILHLIFSEDGRLAERRLVNRKTRRVQAREVYSPDGLVRRFGPDGRQVAEERRTRKEARAPELKPDLKDLVVLPLPWRIQPRPADSQKLDDEAALRLVGAWFASHDPALSKLIVQRFLSRGDRRMGFVTLLVANDLDPGEKLLPESKLTSPLGVYLRKFLKGDRKDGKARARDPKQPLHPTDFLSRMTVLQRLGRLAHGIVVVPSSEMDRLLWYVRECHCPGLLWALVEIYSTPLMDEIAGKFNLRCQVLGELATALRKVPVLGEVASYEHARLLLQAGRRDEARAEFLKLFETSLKAGRVPLVDTAFAEALGEKAWRQRMHQAADRLGGNDNPLAILAVAEMAAGARDVSLAENLARRAVRAARKSPGYAEVVLGSVDLLCRKHAYDRAEGLLAAVLKQNPTEAFLWRAGAWLADHLGHADTALSRLEQALDREWQNRPRELTLESVRADYGKLLDHYQRLAQAAVTLRQRPPAGLRERLLESAERWRSLDPNGPAAQRTAEVLLPLGERELAWDYLTTAVAREEQTAQSWREQAGRLQTQREYQLADRALEAAQGVDPQDPNLLWDRSRNWQQAGQPGKARLMLRRLVEGKWPERYRALRESARAELER
jgi:tetratricopeptide (TPR) repeat protein